MGGDRAAASNRCAGHASGGRPQGPVGDLLAARTGAPWADLPDRYGPHTTCYNRFVRWRKRGIWERIFKAVSGAYDGDLQMINSSSVRVHQHAANGKKGGRKAAWAAPAAD